MSENGFYNNAIFWIEVDRIHPNPFQPRREFDQGALDDLADSIRQYGVLQPLVVTRKEVELSDGGLRVEYELLAGERRLRASRLAGLTQVPVLIRAKEDTDKVKLEIAIIENLQREDLNPIDRAKAFQKLVDDFNMTHTGIAKKIGKSREYVSNSIRLLALPQEIQDALVAKKIAEGHTRPLLMLSDRPAEQQTLLKEIMLKKMTVREAERIARSIATDRARRHDLPPELADLEKELTESLGTRVQIEKKQTGGKVRIDFFSDDDIRQLLEIIKTGRMSGGDTLPINKIINVAGNDVDLSEGESTLEKTPINKENLSSQHDDAIETNTQFSHLKESTKEALDNPVAETNAQPDYKLTQSSTDYDNESYETDVADKNNYATTIENSDLNTQEDEIHSNSEYKNANKTSFENNKNEESSDDLVCPATVAEDIEKQVEGESFGIQDQKEHNVFNDESADITSTPNESTNDNLSTENPISASNFEPENNNQNNEDDDLYSIRNFSV